jgi:hypothetical protein
MSNKNAKDRLEQINSHVKPSRRAKGKSTLPADYSDVLGQITTLQTIAATPNPKSRGYVRQKQAGKLWVRERVEQLLDPASFREVGSVTGSVTWKQIGATGEEPVSFIPSNNVQGRFPGL